MTELQESLKKTGWHEHLKHFFDSSAWVGMKGFLREEYATYAVYPAPAQILRVLTMPLDKVRVVILGQDPYHGPGQANGLAFAVNDGQTIPPSLRNIFSELRSDVGGMTPSPDLMSWHNQGVMLLNTSLTVRHGEPGSHAKAGWAELTNLIIKTISDASDICIFNLWGVSAKSKKSLIDINKHGIIEAGHPSPLSCRFFYGTKPFSKTNEILVRYGKEPIKWSK